MSKSHELTAADILPWAEYAKDRMEHRRRVSAMKRNRRIEVGPHVTFYFENFDTMWLQVQEMLHIEKGGAEQLKDELEAYNPLIPKGHELVATFMIEIADPVRRKRVLDRRRIRIAPAPTARPARCNSCISPSPKPRSPPSASQAHR